MRVTVRRSGGFANIARTFHIDSDWLDENGAGDLQRVVDALRTSAGERARYPDSYRFLIDVDGEEFIVSESWITEALTRLGRPGSQA